MAFESDDRGPTQPSGGRANMQGGKLRCSLHDWTAHAMVCLELEKVYPKTHMRVCLLHTVVVLVGNFPSPHIFYLALVPWRLFSLSCNLFT